MVLSRRLFCFVRFGIFIFTDLSSVKLVSYYVKFFNQFSANAKSGLERARFDIPKSHRDLRPCLSRRHLLCFFDIEQSSRFDSVTVVTTAALHRKDRIMTRRGQPRLNF